MPSFSFSKKIPVLLGSVQPEIPDQQDAALLGEYRKETSPSQKVDGDEDDMAMSLLTPQDDVTQEQFDEMRAKTMYGMVEPLEQGSKRIIFLTSKQCEQIADSHATLEKLLDTIGIGKPQLVINFLESNGLDDFSWRVGKTQLNKNGCGWAAGLKVDKDNFKNSFLSRDEEMQAQNRIDMFMAEVLIPLAEQTCAVVITQAIHGLCALSTSFMKVCSARKAKWTGKVPFTVISMTSNVSFLYNNPDLNAYWRKIRRVCKTWRMHDEILSRITEKSDPVWDIDQHATTLLINDALDVQSEKYNSAAFARLSNAIVHRLARKYPSIAFKTGFSTKYPIGKKNSASLEVAADMAQSGTPTVFLDLRQRPQLEAKSRTELIDEAKAKYKEECKRYLEAGTIESFDVCAIAYFHDILFGDGVAQTADMPDRARVKNANQKKAQAVPLYKAIKAAQDDSNTSWMASDMEPATPDQVMELGTWLAQNCFEDAFEGSLSEDHKAKGLSMEDWYRSRIYAMVLYIHTLYNSKQLYHANLCNLKEVQKLVHRLVRLDRVPMGNPLEGLLVLQAAWCDYDVAETMAQNYKFASKGIFLLQLVLSWLIVMCSCIAVIVDEFYYEEQCEIENRNATSIDMLSLWICSAYDQESLHKSISMVLFGFSAAATLLISLDSLFNAKSRWQQLRSHASRLQNIIWQYRARIGSFDPENLSRSHSPESVLVQEVNHWRDELMAGANLKASSFKQHHDKSVYKHFQYEGAGELKSADSDEDQPDDHHSPVQPQRYIELRVKPTIRFYQDRIPQYARAGYVFKGVVLLLGVAASVLANMRVSLGVNIVTSLGAVITSWNEFADSFRKVERYSRTVVSLEKLLAWWDSLSGVEKVSRQNISQLILASESIIAEEQLAWYSASQKSKRDVTDDPATDDHVQQASGK